MRCAFVLAALGTVVLGSTSPARGSLLYGDAPSLPSTFGHALPPAPMNPALPPRQYQTQDLHDQSRRSTLSAAANLPFPPSAWFDVNNVTSLAVLSQAMVTRMQTWYQDGLYQWTPWWEDPVLGMAYVGLDIALGNQGNKLLVNDLLTKNDKLGYMIDQYIDDQSWWGMFALRAYQIYGNETWLESVKVISANNTLYWDNTCGGGVLWLTYKPQIKNTITNTLYFGILTRLYRLTGDESYYFEAIKTLNWWLGWAFEPSTGRVYDTITGPECGRDGLASYTYNSAVVLYGLADLYYATGNETLLDLGRSIAYAAIRDFTQPGTGVLVEHCETDSAPSPDLPPGCQQDELMFKGILCLAMAEFYIARPDQNIYNFINTQVLSVVWNNLDNTWLAGEIWQGPWNITTAGPKTQINALSLMAAAATINVDFLAKAGKNALVKNSTTGPVAVPSNSMSAGGAATSAALHDTSVASAPTGTVKAGAATRTSVGWLGLVGVGLWCLY